jgi:hypothetical protein
VEWIENAPRAKEAYNVILSDFLNGEEDEEVERKYLRREIQLQSLKKMCFKCIGANLKHFTDQWCNFEILLRKFLVNFFIKL